MRSQGYTADVYELPGCRNAHQCLYTIVKSPLHPLARFQTFLSPIGTRIIQLDLLAIRPTCGISPRSPTRSSVSNPLDVGGGVHAYTLGGYCTIQPIGRNVVRYVAIPFGP